MKARIYAMAWCVLPYVCFAPLGVLPGVLLLVQLLGSAK